MIKRKGNGDIDIDSLEIEDVMDITILQKFQDNFADSMNIASVTVNRDGKPVTRPSCYTNFCSKLTQSTSTGECRCAESHKKGGDEATRLGRPYVFTCHAGLTDFASPIMIDGKSIGTILCGQVVIDHPQEVDLRKKAKEIGVDEDEYVNAANDIKETEERNVQAGTEVLFIVTNALVKIGYESLRVSTVTNNLADNFSQISATMEELAASSVDVSNNQHNLNDEINIVKDISEEINTILDSIKSIADETKMLGLNAAIEAARAGEAGKGFGVVATEIRALSASSKETALTIAQLTKRIQASVDKTLETANSTLETTEQQTAAIQEVSSSIQEVSALADSLNEM